MASLDQFVGKAGGSSLDSFVGSSPQPTNQPAHSDSIWQSLAKTPVGQAVSQAGQQVNQAFTNPNVNPVSQGFDASVAAAGAVPNVVASAIPGGKQALDTVGKVGGGVVDWLGNLIGGTKQAQDFVTKFPQAADALHKTASVGQGLGTISGTILGAQGVASLGDTAVNTVKNASQTAKGASYYADSLKPETTPAPARLDPEAMKIQDLIAPKTNLANNRIALKEGRILPGQEPGFLRDGTPDQILPSDKQIQASGTILKKIPGAADMTQPELHGALGQQVEKLSNTLKPEMQKVPITDDVLGKIQDSWNELKSKQLEDPYASTGANIDKLQSQFETKFLKPIVDKRFSTELNTNLGVPDAGPNMNDLWDTAKAYDNSVPQNVKNANVSSSDALNTQKSIWLQNRSILRNAINDSATGLGKTSQSAFSDMTDMFNAQKGIESSFKLAKEGAASGVKKLLDTPAGKVGKVVVGGGGVVEAGKKLLTGHF